MRLIDADALKLEIACLYGSNPKYLNWLNHAPTVDAVPVVRCKDCMYYRPYSDGKMDCDNLFGMADVDPDGYCSRAERKEE